MTPLRSLSFPSLSITLALLAGCNEEPPNLRPTSIAVLTPPQDVQASHRIDVQIGILSARATEGVGVVYHVLPKAQYLAKDPEMVGSVLGHSAHDVPQGASTFAVELQVPWELAAGEYVILPEVDPQNTIAEVDEKDQTGPTADLVVAVDHRDQPRLMMEQAALDVPAFELPWAFGAPPEPLGLTLLVRADSHGEVANAELTACVRGKGTSCVPLPLGSWDSSQGKRLTKTVIDKLQPGEATSVHLDLQLGAEHYAAFQTLLREVATACRENVDQCATTYEANLECAKSCLPAAIRTGDTVALQACLLKCLPFDVEATISAPPGVALFEPSVADPGRTAVAKLQLVAPPPADPTVPSAIKIWTTDDLVVNPCTWSFLDTLFFAAERVGCTADVQWSVKVVPEQPPSGMSLYGSPGTIRGATVGTDSGAMYTPPACDALAATTKVLVEATACGATDSRVVTLRGRGPSVAVQPPTASVTTGVEGAAAFVATVKDCAAQVAWSLPEPDAATRLRLVNGDKGSLSAVSGLTTSYRPPAAVTAGPPVAITLKATCDVASVTATIKVGLPKELKFERAFAKEFANDNFGAGVDLYSGAFLDLAGGRAKAEARIPVKIFGKGFDLLHIKDEATVDPHDNAAVKSFFDHRIEAFDFTVHSLHCPGDPICTGQATLWSKSQCLPEDPPGYCTYAKSTGCTRSSDCGPDQRCMFGTCTKKCEATSDCGAGGTCQASLSKLVSKSKKVFVIVVVPVTMQAQLCGSFGIGGRLQLLDPDPKTFAVALGPYFEANGFASAAAGYTGLLALGVQGDLVLLRDDFYGRVAATIDLAPGAGCPPSGCVTGELRESVENVLQGGQGKVFLFADYLTLDWCKWHPCLRQARAKKTIVSWGPLFEVANVCKWDPTPVPAGAECTTTADCDRICTTVGGANVCAFTKDWPARAVEWGDGPHLEAGPRPCGQGKADCINGRCVDRLPGLLCAKQGVFAGGN